MEINIMNIIPKTWEIKEVDNKIEVYYKNKRPQNNPKKRFLFNKIIRLDEKFYEGIGLFLGDGDINRKEKRHLTFANKDKDIALHALKFLKNYFNLKIRDVTLLVQYRTKNYNIKKEWAGYLGIPEDKILTRFSARHKHETIQIQVNGVIFRKIFELILEKALDNNLLKEKIARGALLRGLFAAEGGIGIDYKEKKPYISQITFNFNIKEKNLINIITKILDQEKITCRLNPRPKNNSFEIIISNWNNYWKLYQLKTFNLCDRKKQKFIEILHNLKVFVMLDKETIKHIFKKTNLTQKEIANLIKSYQGNVSKIQKGELYLTIQQLNILLKRTNLNKNGIYNKINPLRVGNITKINDQKFKDYIFNQ